MIDSRGEMHPGWVQTAIESVKKQVVRCELIVVKNWGLKKTIGKAWNEGVKLAKGEQIFFLGDDDFISDTYLFDLKHLMDKAKCPMVTSYMTVFKENMKEAVPYTESCTGMWRKDYLLEHPFDEELTKGIDRDAIDKLLQRGDNYSISQHNYGYFYRKHEEHSIAGDIDILTKPKEVYVLAASDSFIRPLADRWDAYVDTKVFSPVAAKGAKVIWCDWADVFAMKAAQYECDARKFLRIHAQDAFGKILRYLDFKKFEKVIFVAKHIKDYVEDKLGKIPNAVVIPNGVDMDKFTLDKDKCLMDLGNGQFHNGNNKIAYAGYLTRKKGIGELFFIAESLPKYEFHVTGKFKDDDVCEFVNKKKPDNVILYPWQYDINEWYQDKSYILNTSLRESQGMSIMEAMSCGLKPLVRDWVGAKEIYGETYKGLDDLRGMLFGSYEPEKYREFIKENYNFKNTYEQIENLFSEVVV